MPVRSRLRLPAAPRTARQGLAAAGRLGMHAGWFATAALLLPACLQAQAPVAPRPAADGGPHGRDAEPVHQGPDAALDLALPSRLPDGGLADRAPDDLGRVDLSADFDLDRSDMDGEGDAHACTGAECRLAPCTLADSGALQVRWSLPVASCGGFRRDPRNRLWKLGSNSHGSGSMHMDCTLLMVSSEGELRFQSFFPDVYTCDLRALGWDHHTWRVSSPREAFPDELTVHSSAGAREVRWSLPAPAAATHLFSAPDRLVVRAGGLLRMHSAAAGRPLWEADLAGELQSLLADESGNLYVHSWISPNQLENRGESHVLTSFAPDGERRWVQEFAAGRILGVVAGNLFVGRRSEAEGGEAAPPAADDELIGERSIEVRAARDGRIRCTIALGRYHEARAYELMASLLPAGPDLAFFLLPSSSLPEGAAPRMQISSLSVSACAVLARFDLPSPPGFSQTFRPTSRGSLLVALPEGDPPAEPSRARFHLHEIDARGRTVSSCALPECPCCAGAGVLIDEAWVTGCGEQTCALELPGVFPSARR